MRSARVRASAHAEETRDRHEAAARTARRLVDDRRRARERVATTCCATCSRRATRPTIQEQVKESGLRGRGGANFSTGQKWSFLPAGVFPRYLVVNGDEGEPSTFKDRMLVERDPHQLIEGIVISAYAISCNHAFIYVRGEFALGYDRLDAGGRRRAGARASSARTSSARASTSRSSCTAAPARTSAARRPALLESLEGERGMPRLKPPFPAIEGLYAKPTVVNNVETLSTRPAHHGDGRRGVRQDRRRTSRPARASSRSPVT